MFATLHNSTDNPSTLSHSVHPSLSVVGGDGGWTSYQTFKKGGFNLGQQVGDKFTKLSKIDFSMEWFIADFLQFFTNKRQNLAFGWTAGYSPSNRIISGIFLKFSDFIRSWVLSRSATPEHSLSGGNNLVPFHLWWRQIVLKSKKVSKCFVQDCLKISF